MSALTAPNARRRGAAAAPRRHLRVVPDHEQRHTLLFALASVALFAITVFGAVSLNALAAGDAVRARVLDRRVVEAEREYSALVARVAELEDPQRIRLAALRLGMVAGEAPQYLPVGRALPADGAVVEAPAPGDTTDPIKPVLAVER